MKFLSLGAGLSLAELLAGCSSVDSGLAPYVPGQMFVSEAIMNASIEKAVVTQHTLYPYHFVEGAAELNPLGERDLELLADHFRGRAGEINVRRGGVPDVLYEERLRVVGEGLAELGLDRNKIALADDAPGGDGISSERAIEILEEDRPLQLDSTTGQASIGSEQAQ